MTREAAGHLAMLVFSALVAGSFALGSKAANLLDPAALNALRFTLATVLIGVVGFALRRIKRSDARAPWRYFVLGALLATYFVLMFEGLKTAAPVSAAAVFTLTPIMAGGFGYLVMRQVMTLRMALALFIGAIGALWVIFRADLAAVLAFQVGRGEAVYFWGCVAHALYAPMVPRLNRGESPVAFTFGTLLAATVILWTLGGPELMRAEWYAIPAVVWITILYTAIAATAATFVLLQFASLRLPAAKVMAYTYLTPSWVILWQIALDGQVPPLLTLGGVGLSILALLLLLRRSTA
ncbi:DMT family transporter [Shimia ponticola]|uniref:DMT family transporter n=1 Tax=Shimia ponticola TaxID=2582893 RepID=UPI0021058F75|nr:DMT family transporter [Shimia ponticola]